MIGTQPIGAIEDVVITAVAHEGLSVLVDGTPGRLAIVDKDGHAVTSSPLVAREAEAVALNSYPPDAQGPGPPVCAQQAAAESGGS